MSEEVDLATVRANMKKIVDANPDFVYPIQFESSECNCIKEELEEPDDDYSWGNYKVDTDGCQWHYDEDTCRYFSLDGQPTCIVGHYAHAYHEAEPFDEGISPSLFLRGYDVTVTEEAAHWLNRIQAAQDEAFSWSESFTIADNSEGQSIGGDLSRFL